MTYLLGYSYGIYLIHLAFIGGLELMLRKLNLHLAPYSTLEKAFFSLCICLCCMVLISLIRMNSFAKLVFLGEAPRPPRVALNKTAHAEVSNSAPKSYDELGTMIAS
jgi:peptidoglycan/LPS O-acetylase OafA/YrhL